MWKQNKKTDLTGRPADSRHPLTGNPLLSEHPPSIISKLRQSFSGSRHKQTVLAAVFAFGVATLGAYYLFPTHAAQGPIGIAFEANTNNLWTANSSGVNTGAGMMGGTSPSITAVPGGAEIAFQANTSDLWVTGPLGTVDTHLGMMADTSPSITYVPGRGYEVAFQANTGNLWLYGQLGTGDQGLGMMGDTSPSIAAVPGGGYAIAFQANTSSLWTVGAFGTKNWGLGMHAGTSPSIAVASNDTYEVAFQANTSDLWSAGSYGGYNYKLGMSAGSSPSITTIPTSSGSAYEMAFQANTGALWTVGHYGTKNWGLGMYAGSSPSITSFGDGSFNVAFEANTTSLWVLDSSTSSSRDLGLGMHAGTSPSIVVANMPTPPNDTNLGASLPIGKSIGVGQALYSPDGVFRAVMQPDSNFVVYLNWDELPSWSTGTNGSGANVLNFQSDGNLVVRPSGGAAAWAAGTNTYGGSILTMQDDGNLVLYQPGGQAVWSWMTGKIAAPTPTPPPTQEQPVGLIPPPGGGATDASSRVFIDISSPQCKGSSTAGYIGHYAYGIVGLNGATADFGLNPCLNDELRHFTYYDLYVGVNYPSAGCSSSLTPTQCGQKVGRDDLSKMAGLHPLTIWIDVEPGTGLPQSPPAQENQFLNGLYSTINNGQVHPVGLYSNANQWSQLEGNYKLKATTWYAGYYPSQARGDCSSASFGGNHNPVYVQYVETVNGKQIDYDWKCNG